MRIVMSQPLADGYIGCAYMQRYTLAVMHTVIMFSLPPRLSRSVLSLRQFMHKENVS
jgi:hypothetical protein